MQLLRKQSSRVFEQWSHRKSSDYHRKKKPTNKTSQTINHNPVAHAVSKDEEGYLQIKYRCI